MEKNWEGGENCKKTHGENEKTPPRWARKQPKPPGGKEKPKTRGGEAGGKLEGRG